jgi:trehalose 6-phosphate synthase
MTKMLPLPFKNAWQTPPPERGGEGARVNALKIDWSPGMLQLVLAEQLPGCQTIVVSNREPYIHNRENGTTVLQTPPSGVVSALEPVMRAGGGTWIAHGSGSADRDTSDHRGCVRVPPQSPAYTLRRIWLSEEEQDGYYLGFANEGLWPLCHAAFERPTFRESDWNHYRAVNRRFADAVVEEAKRDDPVVLVQDYHFALVPHMVREKLPKATIINFWHIPWPSAETFGMCPWKSEILQGLLASTILGFQTPWQCTNFLATAERFIASRVDHENSSVTRGGSKTLVRAYPISIEPAPAALARQKPIDVCRQMVRRDLGLSEETHLSVGVERLDYTKGIPERLRGVDDFLTRHPEWKGRFALFQATAPSRSKLQVYKDLQQEVTSLSDAINEKHGVGDFQPIRLSIRHHDPSEVFKLFRAADSCLVTSLHDGMNLVAKEFVAAHEDELGVLILSSFAGASQELTEALIVNPYNTEELGDSIYHAVTMSKLEQRRRMHLMRTVLRHNNIYRWAGEMLLDAASVRKRELDVELSEPSTGADASLRSARLSATSRRRIAVPGAVCA